MDPLLVDADGLSQMLSISVRTIRGLQERGMPMVRVGRRVLFDPVRVKEWLVQGGAADTKQGAPKGRRPGRPRRIVL
jgi:phage terminase Nu1 subunit (DNA packaging protein)